MSFLRWLSSFSGDPKGSPCCFASKNSPPVLWNRRWGWFELYHGPSKGCGGSNDCKTSHCGWQSLQHTSALVFCWTKKSDESFSYLGGHRLSVSLSFVVHDTTFQICIRGTSKTMMVSICALLSSWSLLSFISANLMLSTSFYKNQRFPNSSGFLGVPAAISGQFLGVGIRPGHVGCGPGQRGGMGSILAKLPSSPWFLGKQRRNSEDLEIFFNSLMS